MNVKRGDTTHPFDFVLTSPVTGEPVTGIESMTITRSQNGGAPTSWAGSWAEIGSGGYKLIPAADDVAVNGELMAVVVAAGTNGAFVHRQVGDFDPYAAVPTVAETVAALLAEEIGGVSVETLLARLDAGVSSRSTFDPTSSQVNVGAVAGNAVTSVDDFKADVSSLATGAALGAVVTHGDSSWATATGFATPGDITSAVTSITGKVRKFFQLLLRKDAAITTDNATELAEINANGGSGAGTFSNQADSVEALRDRGDAAWTGSAAPSAATIAAAVVAEIVPSDAASNTVGGKLNAAGSAGDPWTTEVPGEYAAGSAGWQFGRLSNIETKAMLITANTITVTSPVEPITLALKLVRGDDYTVSSGRPLPQWSSEDWSAYNLSTATIAFKARAGAGNIFTKALTALSDTQVRLELTSAETAALPTATQSQTRYEIEATLATGDVVTLVTGVITLIPDVR